MNHTKCTDTPNVPGKNVVSAGSFLGVCSHLVNVQLVRLNCCYYCYKSDKNWVRDVHV